MRSSVAFLFLASIGIFKGDAFGNDPALLHIEKLFSFKSAGQLSREVMPLSSGLLAVSANDGYRNYVYFLKSDGSVETSQMIAGQRGSELALMADGRVLSGADQLYYFSPQGTVLGSYPHPSGVIGKPLVLPNQAVAFTTGESGNGTVEIIGPDRAHRASFTGTRPLNWLGLGTNGVIVAEGRGALYFLDQLGNSLNVVTAQAASTSPTLSTQAVAKGTVAWGADDGNLYVVSPQGNLLAKFHPRSKRTFPITGEVETNENFEVPSTFLADGTIVAVGNNGEAGFVHFLTPDGKREKARFKINHYPYVSPIILTDGTVAVAADKVYLFRPDGSLKSSFTNGATFSYSHMAAFPGGLLAVAEGTVPTGSGTQGPNAQVVVLGSDGTVRATFTLENEDVISSVQSFGQDTLIVGAWTTYVQGGVLYKLRIR